MAQSDSNAAGTNPTDHVKEDAIPQLIQLFQEQLQATAQREKRLAALLERTLHDGNGQRAYDDRARQHKTVNCSDCPILRAKASLADFVGWKEAWSDFAACQGIRAAKEETQKAVLRQCLDEELRRSARQGVIVLNEQSTVDGWLQALEVFIWKQRNVLLDRMEFYRACQTEGESFTKFYIILKELNAACNFQSPLEAVCHDCKTTIEACEHCITRVKQVHSETMRDRILVGIRSDETRHKLLAKAEITLEEG